MYTAWTIDEIICKICTVKAPVFDRHQFFGTSEHYGKAHGSFLSGWMDYNYTACCWFPTSSNIHHSSDKSGLKVADCIVQSAEYWCFYGYLLRLPNIRHLNLLSRGGGGGCCGYFHNYVCRWVAQMGLFFNERALQNVFFFLYQESITNGSLFSIHSANISLNFPLRTLDRGFRGCTQTRV